MMENSKIAKIFVVALSIAFITGMIFFNIVVEEVDVAEINNKEMKEATPQK